MGHHGVERAQPARVGGAHRQRDVDDVPLGAGPTDVVRPARAGEERPRRLVQRDGQDPRVVPERVLDAVAVVHVDVDVGDALGALLQRPGDGDGEVVVDAEARRGLGHRVVQPAGEVDGVLVVAAPDRAHGLDRGADDVGRRVVHAREHRDVGGAQAVGEVVVPGPALAAARTAAR